MIRILMILGIMLWSNIVIAEEQVSPGEIYTINFKEYSPAIVLTSKRELPILPREKISEYSFTHIDCADVGYNSEHSWTTDRMPEIRVDIEKRERVNARDEADRKQEEERDANLFGICAINDNRWDRTSTYIDCPICGRKMWIRVSDEIISGLRE